MDSRVVPPAALRDPNALELARVWVAEGGLHCSLRVGVFAGGGLEAETRVWGVVLADLIQQVTDALSSSGLAAEGLASLTAHGAIPGLGSGFTGGPSSRASLLQAILDSFQAEIAEPTSTRTGGVVSGSN